MSKLKAKKPEYRERRRAKILISGRAGVGKTSFALNFPNVYYIDSENGAREGAYVDRLVQSGGVYMGAEDGANDFGEVIGQTKALTTEKHPYITEVIDSVSKLFNTAIGFEQTAQNFKVEDYGASKKRPIAKMRELCNWISRVDMNVILIAHEKTKYENNISVGTTFDCWDRLDHELDLILHMEKRGNDRVFVTRKTRLEEFPEGESFPAVFSVFEERFGSDIRAGQEAVKLASAEQIGSIRRLIQVIRIDQEEINKWLTKAKASQLEDFSSEQAEKTLKFLEAKITEN